MLLDDKAIDFATLIALVFLDISLCFGHLIFLGLLFSRLHLFLFFFQMFATLLFKKRVCEHLIFVHNLLPTRLLHREICRVDFGIELIRGVLIGHSLWVLSLVLLFKSAFQSNLRNSSKALLYLSWRSHILSMPIFAATRGYVKTNLAFTYAHFYF